MEETIGGEEMEESHAKHRVKNDEDRPFTPDERRDLRDLLDADQRRMWVVSMIKQISLFIIAIGAAWAVFHDAVKSLFTNH